MGLVDRNTFIRKLAPPLDHLLVTQLVDEFISLERRFIQRDWEPAELDGGQFCEILARIIYHVDSGNLSPSKGVDECLRYIEGDHNPHAFPIRRDALHLGRVVRTVYTFRSQRGAVHISPSYGPNHMDAKFVIESVRWAFAETLRIFWNADRDSVAKAVRELLQFDVPCIGVWEDMVRVQRTDLTAEEEVLVLLHFAGETGFTRAELGRHAQCSASSVTRALQNLEAPTRREVVHLATGTYRLTDLGAKRIREGLADKLLLQ